MTAKSWQGRLTLPMCQLGILHIGQLKGRVLPVAAAKFLDSIITELGARYGDDIDQ